MHARHDVAWFSAWALVVVIGSAVAGWGIATTIVQREARDDAAHQAQNMARAIASPHVYADPTAPQREDGLLELDMQTRDRIAGGLVLRIKVWDANGTVVYSDEPRQIGQSFELEPHQLALIASGDAHAEMTQLDRGENDLDHRLTDGTDSVVEVYAGFVSADGVPMLFEAYFPVGDLLAHEAETAALVVPVIAGGPVVVGLLMFVLGLRMSRRVRRADQESIRAMQKVFGAASAERRRLSRELHDSVLPELASARLVLEAAERTETDTDRRSALVEVAARLGAQMEFLRQVLAGENVPSPTRVGLRTAVEALADQASADGLQVTVEMRCGELDAAACRLALAVASEGLRNVRRHSGAQRATVSVSESSASLLVEVTDDGRGPSRTHLAADRGLGLIADTVSDLGGESGLEARPEGGARVWVSVPLAAVSGEVVRTTAGAGDP